MNVTLTSETAPVAATWRDYVALTKPRIISLLLFTTMTAMFIADSHKVTVGLFLAVMFGGYAAAGAANTLNMVYDRDIDQRMDRTAQRPTVTQLIPVRSALAFAAALSIGSFGLLWAAANLMTGVLAMSGLLFYVVIYTMVLKRRTWQNIVIGGAAGAFPPLVGYAAVTDHLTPLAWLLFAIIFVWTPVHFWALALLIKDEYARVGVPMLPVVHGDKATVIQIVIYTIVTIVVTLVPWIRHEVGWIYLVSAILLNLVLLGGSVRLFAKIEKKTASALFHFSMLYLALLFLAMAIDRSILR